LNRIQFERQAEDTMVKGTRELAFVMGMLACSGIAAGVEGKWTPEQVLEHDPQWLRSLGLEIPPDTLWHPDGGGLLEAAVRIGGCTASFISTQGLMITNHHCAFSILQQHSTPERDLIATGYLATGRDQELPGSGVRATVPHRTTDVTAAIEAAAAKAPDDLARYHAIERKKKELVAACEHVEGGDLPGVSRPATAATDLPGVSRPATAATDLPGVSRPATAATHPTAIAKRCEVATFDGGVRYVLNESLEYPDVRLVYSPPLGIGDFGGEIDNWSWPRHVGDFALLRVYAGPGGQPAAHAADNQPLRPPHFFPVAAGGAHPGDFVMVAGYPGLTFRSLIAPEMRERAERFYPHRAALLRAWLDIMEAASKADATARIALADRVKSLSNVEKNARGQIDGLRRGQVLAKKETADREVLAWAKTRPAGDAIAAYEQLTAAVDRRLATWDRDFLLDQVRLGPKPLDLAMVLVRHAHEAAKPDLEREPSYMDRNRDRMVESLRRDQSRIHPATEVTLLADLLRRFADLPAPQRLPALDAVLAGPPPGGLQARAADLLAHSRVGEVDERVKMWGESEAQLHARRDPLLDLAFTLDAALRELDERDHRFSGAVSRLRPVWQRAVIAHAGKPVAPDANSTLRVTFAHVQGYSPRDGVFMQPQTRLAGLVEKHTGQAPFDAPPALLAAAPHAAATPWADAGLRDVPVDFLADADTTGGNSGSPVLNGRGELVGVNFDRVWENVANDFGYNPDVARNISVDIRYLLWALTTLEGPAARPLLDEMGVAGAVPKK
jgi:hypothetical protein